MGSQPPEPVVDEDSPADEASLSETSPAVADVPDSGAVVDPGAVVDATIVVDPDEAVELPSDPEFDASPPSSGVPTHAVIPRATRIEFLSVRVCIPSVYPECPRQTRRRLVQPSRLRCSRASDCPSEGRKPELPRPELPVAPGT